MSFTTSLMSVSCKTPLSFVPCALIIPYWVTVNQQVRALHCRSSALFSPRFRTVSIKTDNYWGWWTSDTCSIIQQRHQCSQCVVAGQETPGIDLLRGTIPQCFCMPPPPLLAAWLPFSVLGGTWRALGLAGRSRSRIVLGGAGKHEMHPEKTRHSQHVFTEGCVLRHVHFHFLIKTKRRKSWCHLQRLKIFGVSFLATSIYSSSMLSSPSWAFGWAESTELNAWKSYEFLYELHTSLPTLLQHTPFQRQRQESEQVIDGEMPFCSLPL